MHGRDAVGVGGLDSRATRRVADGGLVRPRHAQRRGTGVVPADHARRGRVRAARGCAVVVTLVVVVGLALLVLYKAEVDRHLAHRACHGRDITRTSGCDGRATPYLSARVSRRVGWQRRGARSSPPTRSWPVGGG